MFTTLRRLLILPAFLALAGCGGGGGGAGPKMATVGIALTDAAAPEFDEALATITSIELLGDSGRISLYSGSTTIDLLKLADYSELFALRDDVPSGTYNKIRLQLSGLELVKLDANGQAIETVQARLVANGKLDLNPQGPFFVAPGATLVITIDFDVGKSLKITETGNGRLIVRPVVFVDIADGIAAPGLARIHGVISDRSADDFRLCQTFLAASSPEDRAGAPLGPRERCVRVVGDGNTGVFGPDGLPQEQASLADGDEVTVVGRLRPNPAVTGGPAGGTVAERFVLDAYVVEEGPLGTFRRLRGAVAEALDPGTDRFGLALATGQGIVADGPLAAQLFPQSRIFSRQGLELGRLDLVPGTPALVDGVLALSGVSTSLVRAALVVLDLTPGSGELVLSGSLLTVDPLSGQLLVAGPSGDRCVDAGSADVFLVGEAGSTLSSTRGTLTDLAPGQIVNVFGVNGSGGCFVAGTILARL
ncbi:MAG: DUF4382 domain-containing protein [Gammaproteobacteria bacterium]